MQSKTDAKGQQTVYTYDSLNRLTMTQYYPTGTANPEDGCQRVTYSYDTNPYNSTFSQNTYGRLAAVLYGASTGSIYAPGAFCTQEMFTSGLVTYFADMYSYHPAGGVTAKRLWMARGYSWNGNPGNNFAGMNQANVDVDYTYDNAGRTASSTYPMAAPLGGGGSSTSLGMVALTYGYDSMGRPNSLTDTGGATGWAWSGSGPVDWVQNVQYDYAGRMSSLQYINNSYGPAWTQQSMTYNVNGQLTSLGWATNPYGFGYGTPTTINYTYSATQNNGQITQAQDQLSGETITYQYDALKRLTSASSSPISGSSPAAYTQTYQYDGFGNLTGKVLNGTSTSIPVSAANNRLSSAGYDANGNMTSGSGATVVYDEGNRISSAAETSGGIEYYGYSADNKRFYKYTSAGTEQLTFFGARGEKLGVYSITNSLGLAISPVATNIWFAGRLIVESNEPVYIDRLGTNRVGSVSAGYPYISLTSERFYPYGDEITSTLNDHEKFATYTRDSYTGFDYADQRYYASTYGRFNTADPYGGSAGTSDPGSWNRYSYTRGDPVNRNDRRGLCDATFCVDVDEIDVDVWEPPDGNLPDPSTLGDTCYLVDNWGADAFAPMLGGELGLIIQACAFAQIGGGGGGGGGGDAESGSVPTSVTRAFPFASNPWAPLATALKNNINCDSWLQTAFSNSAYSQQFQSLNDFLTDANGLDAVTGTANFVGGNANGVTGNFSGAPGDLVLINNGGAYFNPLPANTAIGATNNYARQINQINGGSAEAQMFILIHELGHVFNLFQSDASSSASQAQNTAAQASNNDLMWSKCGSLIQGFPNK